MIKILYFPNRNKIKKVSKKLSTRMPFNYICKHKKNIYLENDKYLIVISKHFIRVSIFNKDNIDDINLITKEMHNINEIKI